MNSKERKAWAKRLAELNTTLNPHGVTALWFPSEDDAVDSELTLFVEGSPHAVGSIQIASGYFCANVWTSPARDEMHHAHEERRLSVAIDAAMALLRRYAWIPSPDFLELKQNFIKTD